ncbi:hypothetical protein DFS33DRAFT_1269942 [Desarmillaria ectypa]|nr:hypothetical protein DFS33DRAFT_1269942 [Desarmillaria ectypa]
MSQKNILVTESIGRQGQAFISALRDAADFHVLALTRNSSSRKARRLLASASNVMIIKMDLDSDASIRNAFENTRSTGGGTLGVFCVSRFSGTWRKCRWRRDKGKGGDRILRPGFLMDNYEGIVSAITVPVLKAGLQSDTTIQLVILFVVGEVYTIFEQEEDFRRRTGRDLPSATVSVGNPSLYEWAYTRLSSRHREFAARV